MSGFADVSVDLSSDTTQCDQINNEDNTEMNSEYQMPGTQSKTQAISADSSELLSQDSDQDGTPSATEANTEPVDGSNAEEKNGQQLLKDETNLTVAQESDEKMGGVSDDKEDSMPAFLDGGVVTTTATISSYFGSSNAEDDPFGSIVPPDQHKSPEEVSLSSLTSGDTAGFNKEEETTHTVSEPTSPPPVEEGDLKSDDLMEVHEKQVNLSESTLNEVNRMYDAWIPGEATKRLLAQAISTEGSISLLPDQVIRPRLAMADTQADPVYSETYKLRGESETNKRKVPNLTKVEHNMSGLNQLIRAECWRSALDLTALLLTNMGQGLQPPPSGTSVISEQALKIWTCRIALLTKLKYYSIAEAECSQFHEMDSPELYFQYHYNKYPNRTGSMVPFSMRLLYANLPQYVGRQNESLDRLFHIKGQVLKILHNLQNGLCEDGSGTVISVTSRNASITLWHQRELQVLYSLAGCLVEMKDFRLALSIYDEILKRDPDNTHFTYSSLGRLCLQMGALSAAEDYFSRSAAAVEDETLRKQLNHLHNGYMAVSRGDFKQAPENFMQFTSPTQSLNPLARNNAAVSTLYNGDLKAAIIMLEELVHSDPKSFLQDNILLNLCTLYELESSVALTKKHQLLFLANQYKGNGFNINSLKITLS